jgi:hypothetical protein
MLDNLEDFGKLAAESNAKGEATFVNIFPFSGLDRESVVVLVVLAGSCRFARLTFAISH